MNTEPILPLDQLHRELRRRQITLEMSGTQLMALDPYQRLSPALDMALRSYKTQLVQALQPVSAAVEPFQTAINEVLVAEDLDPVVEAIQAGYERDELTQVEAEQLAQQMVERARDLPATFAELPLADFAQSGQVRAVHSKVLDETLLWAADNAEVSEDNELVVYRASELMKLAGVSPAQLKKVHLAKQLLDGEVVKQEDTKLSNQERR